MKETATFTFSGQDSLLQFIMWLLVFLAGGLLVPLLMWLFGGKLAAAVSIAVALMIIFGLRASIVVTPSQVIITRKWIFIPYRRYTGPVIEDVWFGGDWGEPEGASGVVVQVNGKEIHIGSRKTMHYLHKSLYPLRKGRIVVQPQAGSR